MVSPLNEMVGVETTILITPPTIFSMMKKIFSEARKTGCASRIFVLVPQNLILIGMTIPFAGWTAVRQTKSMISGLFTTIAALEKISFGSGNIFAALKTMVFASTTAIKSDRGRMSCFFNILYGVSNHGPWGISHGL